MSETDTCALGFNGISKIKRVAATIADYFFQLSSAILRSLVLLWGFVCLIGKYCITFFAAQRYFFMLHEMFFFLNRRWSLALADFYPRYISLTFQLTIVWISYQARYCVRFGIFSDNTSI